MADALRGFLRVVALVPLLTACGQADDAAGGMGMSGMGSRGPVPVVVAPVVSERFTDAFSALGSVRAREAVDIKSRISSVVTKIHFDEGQRVNEGDLLVELDDREIAAEVGMAQAAYDKVRTQYERSRTLREDAVVSESELDQLAADVRSAEADLQAARARLDHCSIRAPISGIVGLRNISRGGLVSSDTLITTLDDTDLVRLDFAVPETFLSVVGIGMDVAAASAVYPDDAFSGRVTSIDSRIDPVTRSITVVATIPNDDGRLKPGMFMTVELQRTREDVLLIPEQALAPRSGRQFVYVVEDGKALEREVELGVRAPGRVEVTAGVGAGQQVIIEGIQKVRSGAAVSVSEAPG